jgi:Holliday junction resolvasome RuvABC DNA-binding subunit
MDRIISVEKVKNSEIFCNVVLETVSKHHGGFTIYGFTEGEAKELFKKLGDLLGMESYSGTGKEVEAQEQAEVQET